MIHRKQTKESGYPQVKKEFKKESTNNVKDSKVSTGFGKEEDCFVNLMWWKKISILYGKTGLNKKIIIDEASSLKTQCRA